MTNSFLRLTFFLALAPAGVASTINLTFNGVSGSGFSAVNTTGPSACQGSGLTVTCTNAQNDTATVTWGGITNSIGFNSGPMQAVNFGNFSVNYQSSAGDLSPVSIAPLSFNLIADEFAPVNLIYQPMVLSLAGALGGNGSVGVSTIDLRGAFSPASVTNGADITIFAPASTVILGSGVTNLAGTVQMLSSAPEPSTWVLMGMGLAGVWWRRRG